MGYTLAFRIAGISGYSFYAHRTGSPTGRYDNRDMCFGAF